MKCGTITLHKNIAVSNRIDPSYHLSDAIRFRGIQDKLPYGNVLIKNVVEKVFIGNIFSRIFVKDKEHGVPYLSASDTVLADLDTNRFLSNKQSEELNYLKLHKNWILITCSGTIGNVIFTNSAFEGRIATHDLIRIIPDDSKMLKGIVFAYLSSKYGYCQLTQSKFGAVVKHINIDNVYNIAIPSFPTPFQEEVSNLVEEASKLREDATVMLKTARKYLKNKAELRDLSTEDYDYFGPQSNDREVSCFIRSIKDINTTTINAFNHSERIRTKVLPRLKKCKTISLYEALDANKLQSPIGVSVKELKEGHGIMLINQSDIFNQHIQGKWVVNRPQYKKYLLRKGEILIAKIGTLGENETFCRCMYVGDELNGQLVSSAFYRMSPAEGIPSGYLYAWLSSDYGFRLIRSTQYGTKQCYPNPKLLYILPVPILEKEDMDAIHTMVCEAYSKQYEANSKEKKAIKLVENEIDSWSKN